MDVKKGKKAGKGKSPLHIRAFHQRVVVEGEVFDAVVSEIKGPNGETTVSSLPHLTHEKDARAAHITSSRVVAVSGAYVIHQRFHQNDDGASEPTHDRYFAVHTASGVVHAATAKFKDNVHLGKKDELPMRGQTLAKTDGLHELKLEFTVGDPDVKVPPFSPRSIQRKLPPTGYQ